jgi:hypothetical protein
MVCWKGGACILKALSQYASFICSAGPNLAPGLPGIGAGIGMADPGPIAGYRLSRGPLEVQPIGCKSGL